MVTNIKIFYNSIAFKNPIYTIYNRFLYFILFNFINIIIIFNNNISNLLYFELYILRKALSYMISFRKYRQKNN